ncbi:retrovirus-related pol polyprotein from transposon TNT 1-94 [Tanacetum coccineum]
MSNTNNNNMQTQTLSALYNAIMEAGGKDRPPMLAPGNYVKWKSRIKRYIDTKPNHELIHFCLKNPPYQYRFLTTYANATPVTPGNKDIQKWITAEAIQIILMGIDNDISTVDACPYTMEMWKAIKRLKQGESINVQDLETNLYWEFGKFTSQNSESLESYYSRFYKRMNELVRIQCIVANHQVNVQFLLQLKPEWQRNRGKAIANSPQPTYDPEPEVVADDDTSSKENEIDKLMALISMSFKKIYKPTNNNLITSLKTKNLNVDNTPRSNRGTWYDIQTRQYDNQRAINIVGARENVGTQVVQQTGIQCYNCKEFGHVARECQKLKRAWGSVYHKEKMLLCKQEEAGIQLSSKQVDWRDDTDDEPEC